ncbi:hypothetical protein [Lactococcus garvieae]
MTILYFVATIILMTLYVIGYNATEIENLEDAIQEPPQRVKTRKNSAVGKKAIYILPFSFFTLNIKISIYNLITKKDFFVIKSNKKEKVFLFYDLYFI